VPQSGHNKSERKGPPGGKDEGRREQSFKHLNIAGSYAKAAVFAKPSTSVRALCHREATPEHRLGAAGYLKLAASITVEQKGITCGHNARDTLQADGTLVVFLKEFHWCVLEFADDGFGIGYVENYAFQYDPLVSQVQLLLIPANHRALLPCMAGNVAPTGIPWGHFRVRAPWLRSRIFVI
jgi:hypothetical protein